MGVFRFLIRTLLQGAFIFLSISLIPGIPPHVQFTKFEVTPPLELQGTLSVNTLLNNAEHLYSGKLHGPEALVDYKGVLYTGLHGGEIVKFVDEKIVPVTKFGERCDGFLDEKNCGRPLGMKFGPDGFLFVVDAYFGVYKVDVNTGTKIQLISIDDIIDGKKCKFPNSIDVSNDGTLFWSCSSTNFILQDGVYDALADGSGRLLKYDPKTKKSEVLLEGLQFPNGIALSPEEDFVLIAETLRSRLKRYYLKGPKKGNSDLFIDGLPGLPDNLKSDGQGGFLVPLIVVRDKHHPVLFQSIGPFPMLRKFLARSFALIEMGFEQIDRFYPNYYAKKAIHWIGHFESLHSLTPKGFILLQLDVDGNIKHSFHNTDHSLLGISEAHWFNGAFYFGSPYNTYVGKVKLSFAESEGNVKKEKIQNLGSERKVESNIPVGKDSQKFSAGESSKESIHKEAPYKQAPLQESAINPQKPSPPPQPAQKKSIPQSQSAPSPSHQDQKPTSTPQQPQTPSPPSQPLHKQSQVPQQPQKPSSPPQQPQKTSSPQEPQKSSPKQPQKPTPSPQQPSPPVQQPQKTSSPQEPQKSSPKQPQKPTPSPQKPSPPVQQPQNPSPKQPQKPTPSPQQPSPPVQQPQKSNSLPQQPQKPSPKQPQKPTPTPQQPPPPVQQPQKPSPPAQQHQKPSPPAQQPQSRSPQEDQIPKQGKQQLP